MGAKRSQHPRHRCCFDAGLFFKAGEPLGIGSVFCHVSAVIRCAVFPLGFSTLAESKLFISTRCRSFARASGSPLASRTALLADIKSLTGPFRMASSSAGLLQFRRRSGLRHADGIGLLQAGALDRRCTFPHGGARGIPVSAANTAVDREPCASLPPKGRLAALAS